MLISALLLTAALDAATLQRMAARFAPTEVTAGVDALPAQERAALAKIVEAARIFDTLFLRQVWSGNEPLLLQLAQDATPLGRARLHLFVSEKGPWSSLDHNAPFIPGVPPRPDEGTFYPPGSSKGEIDTWYKSLSPREREAATGFFTVIRRTPDGRLGWVPYSIEYQDLLGPAAQLLREAAALTQQPTLRRFLQARADSFLSNDYYATDVAWMELDSSIEPTLGPYEVYADNWFNQKAAFEAFIALREEAESQKLQKFVGELQGIEDALPIDPKLRNPMMLRNVQEAKFRKTLLPISRIVLNVSDRRNVSFDAFFTHIVMHELMHGLGPHQAASGVPVRVALQEANSALEEAKADISGLFALRRLVDKGVLDRSLEKTMYVTFLVSAFRTIRFGTSDAHGKGQALQLNFLLDAGAVHVAPDGTFSVDPARIKEAVTKLTAEIMTLQATGDAARAREWLKGMGVVRPEVQHVLDKLGGVPVDIEPRFTAAEKLLRVSSEAR